MLRPSPRPYGAVPGPARQITETLAEHVGLRGRSARARERRFSWPAKLIWPIVSCTLVAGRTSRRRDRLPCHRRLRSGPRP